MQDKKLQCLEVLCGSCARTSREAAPLGQVTASCRTLQTKAKVVPHAKKSHQ